jgi:probable F420-dependent oxidoreductase
VNVGRVGIWWSGSWRADTTDAPAELEELGYTALWLSNGFGAELSDQYGRLLSATRHIVIASGIASVWHTPVSNVVQAVQSLGDAGRDRFLLGLGTSHQVVVESGDQRYERPYSRVVEYLDALDASTHGVPASRRVLAALGPRMLHLAADRALGAHPYFVPVEHTARAREILGSTALLAPELAVVVETDPLAAREKARRYTERYLTLPNYTSNLRALGYGDDDLAGAGSDRLVDAIVAWGDPETIATRVRQHHDAGADHVCVQVVADRADRFPIDAYRRLAPAVLAQ